MRLSFQDAPSLSQPTARARAGTPAPRWGEGDAEHVASFPPAHARHPNGGGYVTQSDIAGFHVGFLPGGNLDPGRAYTGKGMQTQDGHRLRTQDVNPTTALMNARARAFWKR